MTDAKKPTKTMPKGGRKGGATFPRMNLETAVGYAKRLVSKTHTGPQAKDIIYSGVLDTKSARGDIKISALKQYGFVSGDTKEGFSASEPARRLAAAPKEELVPHYRAAALRPKIFKALFNTYHGDVVSRGKLKQRAADLNVHPDEVETCVEIYLQSALLAALVTAEGDVYRHVSSSLPSETAIGSGMSDNVPADDAVSASAGETESPNSHDAADTEIGHFGALPKADATEGVISTNRPRAVFNVNVTLDSSLDIDKLQKQLELLKRFGAL